MASKKVNRHIQIIIIMYVLMFALIMYFWQKSSSQLVRDITEFSLQESKHRDQHPPRQSMTLTSNSLLVITGDAVNGSSVKDSDTVGVREGEKGGDHTLTSRLTSVFKSVLDCPSKVPLTFLGMNWSSADLSLDPACSWISDSIRNEEQNFVALGGELAVLKDVTLDPRKFSGTKGGEKMESVFNQTEDSEYFSVKKGFFSLPCRNPPAGVKFHVDKRNYRRFNHLNQWLSSLTCTAERKARPSIGGKPSRSSLDEASRGYVTGVTFALERFEYANLFHTTLDWYHVFISFLILGIDPNFATFLIVDGHPWGKLDSTWANMFGGRGVLRAGHLPDATTFEYMVWVPNGYHCPLYNMDRKYVPYLPQLREFFYRSYGLVPNPGPNCQRLRLLLIWRRDYLAHPRNPKGRVERKIDNEKEIHEGLATAFPQHEVRGEQLDRYTVTEQLDILRQTDLIVGMHGAALTYTTLLPEGAGLVEMYPLYAGRTSLLFEKICQWRGIHYVKWMNYDKKNEKPNKFTYIPIPVVVDLVQQVMGKMCPGK